jgi:hypothetical protein
LPGAFNDVAADVTVNGAPEYAVNVELTYARFIAGTGGTRSLGPTAPLTRLAAGSPAVAATLASIRNAIATQTAAMAVAGAVDPSKFTLTVPATHFELARDGSTLKAVIGGTQGEQLCLLSFTADMTRAVFTADVRLVICDDFGVDNSDLYAPGLIPFWILQHERTGPRPFIHELTIETTLSGRF